MKRSFTSLVFVVMLMVITLAGQPPVALADEAKQEVAVTNVHGYQDADSFFSYYHIVGSVQNNADTAVNKVELALTAKDAEGKTMLRDYSGNPVESITINPILWTIEPGQASPFAYSFSLDNGQPAAFAVELLNYQTTEARETQVEVQHGQMVTGDNGMVYLTGELVNLGKTRLDIKGMAGAALDKDNQVVAANTYEAGAGYLAPAGDARGNDRIPFRFMLTGPAPTAENWAVYVDASPAQAEEIIPLELSEPYTYVDAAGSVHVVGSVINKTEDTIELYLLVGLYAADGTVLDAEVITLPYALQPGQSVPYSLNSFSGVDHVARQADKIAQTKVWVTTAMVNNNYEYVSMKTDNDQPKQTDGVWSFSGEATNNSDKTLSWATVVVALYDQEGQLLATYDTDIYGETGMIEPNSTTAYALELNVPADLDPAKVTVKTLAQGMVN